MSIFHDNIREILEDAQRFLLVTLSKEVLSASAISHKQGLLSKIDRFRHDHPQLHLEKLAEDGDYLQSSSPQPYTDMHGNVGKVMNDENDRPAEISSLETNSDYETFGSESGERQDRRKITNNESGDHSSNDTSGLMSGYLAKKGKEVLDTGVCRLDTVDTMLAVPRKSYDLCFKVKAMNLAKDIGNRAAARELNVDEKQIRDWRKQALKIEESVEKSGNRRRVRCGGGRKPLDIEVEKELALWILTQPHHVTRKAIQMKAKSLRPADNFKASNGWVDKFLHRHEFVIRASSKTSVSKCVQESNYMQSDAVIDTDKVIIDHPDIM